MRKCWEFIKRNRFLLLLLLLLGAGELVLSRTDPVRYMDSIWRNDYEIIALEHPDMTFDRAFFGSSVVIASYIEGQNDTGYVNLGIDYGTVKDITEMLEKGFVTIKGDLVLGLNDISFLDSLPTNPTYPWHRHWYEPYLYFQRDRLSGLITNGVDNLLNGRPFSESHPVQNRAVYYGAISDEELKESEASMLERFGDMTVEDCAENFAALDRLAAYCQEHGIRLRAVWMPWNSRTEIYESARALMDYADEQMDRLGIEVLDLTDAVPVEYFYDMGHLDYETGAPWFTDLLDPWLAEEEQHG